MENNKTPGKKPSKKRPLNAYAKYSGIAFQMVAVILVGVWGGVKLDEHFELETPLFTLGLSMLALGLGMYLMIKGVINDK